MSNFYSSSSSQSYVRRATSDVKTQTCAYTEQNQTNPEVTTVRTAYWDNDKHVEYSEEHYPSGRQLGASSNQETSRRIEDIDQQEADRCYKEAIENEYAKREGGT